MSLYLSGQVFYKLGRQEDGPAGNVLVLGI